jgi:hypothetical protein
MVQYIAIPVRKNAGSRLQTLRYGITVHTGSDWRIHTQKAQETKTSYNPIIQYGTIWLDS